MKSRTLSRRSSSRNPKRRSLLSWLQPQPRAGRKLRFESLEDRRVLADGDLDALNFATSPPAGTPAGVARTNFSATAAADQDQVQRIGIQSTGKIIAAGHTTSSGASQLALVRYNADGTLDTTFGGAAMGKVVVPNSVFGATVSRTILTDMVVTPTDKIVLVGSATSDAGGPCMNGMSFSTDWAIAVFNADGTPDMGFDTDGDGFKAVSFFDCADNSSSVAVQPADGKILVIGSAFDFGVLLDPNDDLTYTILARFNTDGSPDATFNGGPGGVAGESRFLPPTVIGTNDMVVLPAADPNAGKIISVGSNGNFLMNRFTTTGALDATFGTGGAVSTPFPSGATSTANAVALYTDGTGRILLAGDVNSGSDFALARYNANGSLDDGTATDTNMADTFSGDGKFVTDVSAAAMMGDSAKFVGILSDGKIVASGVATSPMVPMGSGSTLPSVGILKLNTDGTLDPTFGTGGIKLEHFGDNGMGMPVHQNRGDSASGGALQTDGKILVGGQILAENENNPDFFVARFLNTLPGPPSADLAVTKSDSVDPAIVGSNLTYTITVTNIGPSAATGVTTTDTLPAGVSFVSANSSQGSCTGTATVVCNLGTLASLASVTVQIVVTPTAVNPALTNMVSVDGTEDDPIPGNNSDTEQTAVILTPPLPTAGQLLISEFRLQGPGGLNDEFVEIYNNTDSDITVAATDGSAGFALAASDGVVRFTILNGTVIPARGHFLGVNSVGYSLASYPAGNGTTATGDATYTVGITDGEDPDGGMGPNPPLPHQGIALFNTANPANFTLANRLDAAGSTSEANTLYKEGTGYPALVPFLINYSFFRDACGKQGSITTLGPCTADGVPKDTNNNAVDFVFVDTNGTSAGAGQRLGAPGPENLSSPIALDAAPNISRNLLDSTVAVGNPPNMVVDFTSVPAQNSTFGTVSLRRRFVNDTGGNLTRLRFRIVDLTTFPAPSGTADLRPRNSSAVVVAGINDAATCAATGTPATAPCMVTAQGTTLEQPPNQPNGGGFNSTLSAGTVTLATPLADGASINLQFLFGVQQTGTFKVGIELETLPGAASKVFVVQGSTNGGSVEFEAGGADFSVTKTDSPDPVVAGTNLTYTITLTNSGPSAAQTVSLSDVIPTNTTFVSFTAPMGFTSTTPAVGGTGTVTTEAAAFGLGNAVFTLVVNVNAGTSSGTILSNTATVSSVDDPTAGNNSDTETTNVVVPPTDLAVTKNDSPDPVVAGTNVTYTVTLTNAGPNDAQAVQLTDAIPTGTTFVSFTSPAGWTITPPPVGGTGTILATNPTVAMGTNVFTLVVNVNANVIQGSIITNTATASSASPDPNGANNADTETTGVIAQADLQITKDDSPDPVAAGANLTYSITVTNAGPSDSQNLSLSDLVPTNTTFVAFTAPLGWTAVTPAAGGTGTVTANRPSLAAGATAVFTLIVNVNSSTPQATTISNTAIVSSATTDPNAANNTDTETTTVTGTSAPVDVSVKKDDSPDPIEAGTNLTYTITVANAGPGSATGVSLTDVIPASTTFVSFTAPAGWIASTPPVGGTGIVNATNSMLASGAADVFTLVVSVDAATPDGSIISNTATVIVSSGDLNLANNTDTETTDVGIAVLPECEVITLNSPGSPGTATIEDDADNPGNEVLIVTGTSGKDVIVVAPQPKSQGKINVARNGRVIVTLISTDVPRIVVFGLEGNDSITVSAALRQSATILGGSGDDTIVGGSGHDQIDGDDGKDKVVGGKGDDLICGGNGNDVVVGGLGNDSVGGDAGNDKVYGEAGNDFLLGNDGNDSVFGGTGNDRMYGLAGNDQVFGEAGNDIGVGGDGNDKLYGGSGRDVLIGGDGLDTLFGNGHDDILVAGSTSHDEDDEALQAILAEWTSANSYTTRVDNLRNGGGANAAFVLDDTTVTDDGLKDTLWGDGGLDWFLFGDGDKLKDKSSSELVN